jgi:hypothetical protein
MCDLNKYIIISVNSKDSIRNLYFHQNVDWQGETHNGRAFWICSANPNILILSLLWI